MVRQLIKANSGQTLLKIILIAAAYYLLAKLGFSRALSMGDINLVWLPSGLALAALILYGWKCWPGVALGSLLANLGHDMPPLFILFVVMGNTLSASVSAWVLMQIKSFSPALKRIRDVQLVVIYGHLLGATISSLIGAIGWTLAGLSLWSQFFFTFFTWLAADASGILLLTPPLLIWLGKFRFNLRHATGREVAVLFGLLAAVSFYIYTGWAPLSHTTSLAYTLFPFLIWAALRLGPGWAAITVLVGSMIAIWGTAQGNGPFILGKDEINFLYLHVFIDMSAATSLLLAAVVAERSQARLDLLHSDSRFQRLFEDNPVGLLQTSPDGKIIDCNSAAIEIAGYLDKATFLAENVINLYVDPSERAYVVDKMQREKVVRNYELRIRRYDGSLIWTLFSSREREEPEIGVFFETAIQDINLRKQAEEALTHQLEVNQRLLKEAHLRTRELGTMVSLSTTLRKAQSQKDIYSLLTEQTREIFEAGSAYLYRLENDGLILAACSNCLRLGYEERIPRQPGHLFWETIDTRSMQSGFHRIEGGEELRRWVVPLQSSTHSIGILGVDLSPGKGSFNQEDLHLLTGIAEIAGNALQRASIMDTLENRVIERTRQLTALYGITSIASEALDLKEVLGRSLEELLLAMGSKVGAIYFSDNGIKELNLITGNSDQAGTPGPGFGRSKARDALWYWALSQGEPLLIPDVALDQRIPRKIKTWAGCAFMAAPLKVNNQILGVAGVFGSPGKQYNVEDIALLAAIADQIGAAIETAHLRTIAQRAAVGEERQRLGRELHDSVTQSLYSMSLMADAANQLAAQGAIERARYYIQEFGRLTQQALKEMRLLIHELRPPDLKEQGVEEALRQRLEIVERRSGISYQFTWQEGMSLSPRLEECLYWVSVEALNNILKHASATSVTLQASVRDGWVNLAISDNGVGLDPLASAENMGLGLKSIRERVGDLGGRAEVESKPGQGVRLCIQIPVEGKRYDTGSKEVYLFQKEKS
jgi:PAS domain S-box-containing protein